MRIIRLSLQNCLRCVSDPEFQKNSWCQLMWRPAQRHGIDMRVQFLHLPVLRFYPALFDQSTIFTLWPISILLKTLAPNSLERWIWGFLPSPHSAALQLYLFLYCNPGSPLGISTCCTGQQICYSYTATANLLRSGLSKLHDHFTIMCLSFAACYQWAPGAFLYFTKPQFPHLYNRDKSRAKPKGIIAVRIIPCFIQKLFIEYLLCARHCPEQLAEWTKLLPSGSIQ